MDSPITPKKYWYTDDDSFSSPTMQYPDFIQLRRKLTLSYRQSLVPALEATESETHSIKEEIPAHVLEFVNRSFEHPSPPSLIYRLHTLEGNLHFSAFWKLKTICCNVDMKQGEFVEMANNVWTNELIPISVTWQYLKPPDSDILTNSPKEWITFLTL